MKSNVFDEHKDCKLLQDFQKDERFGFCQKFEDLWSYFKGLEDSHFWSELDTNPQSRTWEMMVAKLLKEEGFFLSHQDHGPDFIVSRNGNLAMYVEAVCPKPGSEDNPEAVPEIQFEKDIADSVPIDEIVLRIRAGFKDKFERFKEYLSSELIVENVPLVIAINTMGIYRGDHFNPPLILRALLGYGSPYLTFNRKTGETSLGIGSKEFTHRKNGSKVDLIPFLLEEHSLISGVLFSESNFFSVPYDLCKDSMFIHNPRARIPIPTTEFKSIAQHVTTISPNGCSTSIVGK